VAGELRVGLEAIDRADLGELEQRRRGLRSPLFEFAVELRRSCESVIGSARPVHGRPAPAPPVSAGEPAAHPIEMHRPVERSRRDREGSRAPAASGSRG
jgi:hypothetical protein